MTKWFLKSKRKMTGALRKRHMKKKRYQMGRDFLPVHIGDKKVTGIRTTGGNEKRVARKANIANVMINGKAQKISFKSVKENKADSQFVRRNIVTKGAIIDTELGLARVTSRPGQHGMINAILIGEKKK